MSWLGLQFNLFLIALSFLTRVPILFKVNYSQANLNKASQFFPVVGWLIGLFCASIFWLAYQVFSLELAVVISMIFSFLLTGGFHEDGLADTCDGLGGGWTVEQKLSIMKDSTIGTYGSLGLWSILLLKFLLLTEINTFYALLVAHPVSRILPILLIYILPYVQINNDSKVKPLAEKISFKALFFAVTSGLIALFLVPYVAVWILVLMLVFLVLFYYFLKKQLGGFTGDTLGASQQIMEILIYIAFVISAKYNLGVIGL